MDPASDTTTESRLDATRLGELLEHAKALLAQGAGGTVGGAHDRRSLASKLRALVGEDALAARAERNEPRDHA